ncbi:MAG: hypothetical protein J6B87_03905 [Clostridia bacterium]|nr:hypothetical protein [Clostridia bacterium]
MKKLLAVCKDLCESIPQERLENLVNVILVKPVERAAKKMENEAIADTVQSVTTELFEEFSPETMAMFIIGIIVKSDKAKDFEELLEMYEGIKPHILRFVDAIEKNAVAIGQIVEHVILVGNDIKNDLKPEEKPRDRSNYKDVFDMLGFNPEIEAPSTATAESDED